MWVNTKISVYTLSGPVTFVMSFLLSGSQLVLLRDESCKFWLLKRGKNWFRASGSVASWLTCEVLLL